jgi:hypothetical protein
MAMHTEEGSVFKDDWNMNASFLEYCTGLIIEQGRYARIGNATLWASSMRELYRLVSGLVLEKASIDLGNRFNELNELLENDSVQPNSSLLLARKQAALDKCDQLQIELISAMHKARLILPRSERRGGLSGLREEYGLKVKDE